jgi:DNA uptake protein ComE-like DNA-binding protein
MDGPAFLSPVTHPVGLRRIPIPDVEPETKRGGTMKVNVNEADQQGLDAVGGLRGHGFEIVRYREERGRFTDLRQLEEVPGLSGKVDDATRAVLEV